MPHLLAIIDEPKGTGVNISPQPSLKNFFTTKAGKRDGFKAEEKSENNKLMNLLLNGRTGGHSALSGNGTCSSWKENSISNAEILLTNRIKTQEARTGWRVGADGKKSYTTYRGGKLITGEGAEAFSLSMGDTCSKRKGTKDKGVKRKACRGDVLPAKVQRAYNGCRCDKSQKETQKRLDDVVIREQSPRTILPETYTGASSSVDAGTVDDWGFS